mgnify:CR=1 FL=1
MKTVKIKRAISLLCLLFFSLFMNGQQAGYTKARNYTAEKILPYLIYQDREGNTVDTMFDGVHFLALFTYRWNGNNGDTSKR